MAQILHRAWRPSSRNSAHGHVSRDFVAQSHKVRECATMGQMGLADSESRVVQRAWAWMPGRCVVAFAATVAVFHHLPTLAGVLGIHDAVDLVTPFAVVGVALAALLSLRASPRALLLAFVGALLYVDGHGIHLAANSIR